MPADVRLIEGPARSGKTTLLLDRYREFLRPRRAGVFPDRGLWIGPNHQAVAQVRDTLATGSCEAFLAPEMITFAGFAESIIAESGRPIRPISRLQKRRILNLVTGKAVEQNRLRHFAPVARTAGFLAQLDEMIAELKRRDIWPEQFTQNAQNQRERELAEVYESYQRQLLSNDFYDAEGRFWAAREALSQHEAIKCTDFGLIAVDGFSDFTESQYDILGLLAEDAKQLQISLTLDHETSDASVGKQGREMLFTKTNETYQRLKQAFPHSEVEAREETFFTKSSLKHLERNLFREPQYLDAFHENAAGIEIVAANSIQGEIEELAQRVKSLLLGKARPQEILVVFRSLEDIAGRVARAFDDHGIPLALDVTPRLATAPLIRSITLLLRLHADDWPFRELLGVIANRCFCLGDEDTGGPADSGMDARSALEYCIRTAQIPSGKQELLEQLQHWAAAATSQKESSEIGSKRSETTEFAPKALVALGMLQDLSEKLDLLPDQATLSAWIEHLEQLVMDAELFQETGESRYPTTKQAWSRLAAGLRALEGIENSSENQLRTVPELIDLVLEVARDDRLPVEQDAVGRVRVLSAEAARHVAAKHVFLAGLSEQAFSSNELENRLFDVSTAYSAAGQRSSQDNSHSSQESQLGEAMFLFYELATRATESLTLSYPALDAKGQALPPSPLLVELQRCFGENVVLRNREAQGAESRETRSTSGRSAFRQQAIARALEGDQALLAGLVCDSGGTAILDGIECIAERSKRDEFGVFEGLLLSPAAQQELSQRFDSQHLWSASQLESYAACPFRFFSEQLLSLEPPGDLVVTIDPLRRGSLLHQVLATLHEQLQEEDVRFESTDSESTDLIERFRRVLDDVVASTMRFGLQRSLQEIERRELEAQAADYAQQESDYHEVWKELDEPPRPVHFEVRFGPQTRSAESGTSSDASTPVPFELDLGDEKILLTGQVDRIDFGRVNGITVFNIIDYKSGKGVKLQTEKIRSGHQLQLPLYAMAAERLLFADQGAVALSAGYWSVGGKGFHQARGGAFDLRQISGKQLDTTEQWRDLEPQVIERVGQLVGGVRRGEFPVYNQDEKCTSWCPFSTICRVAQIRSLEKAWAPQESAEME